jgi:isopenicillin N synthase-like dioxygenase
MEIMPSNPDAGTLASSRRCQFSPLREAVKELPVIDISSFLPGGDASRKGDVSRTLRKACIDVGFFYLSGHNLPTGELDQAITYALHFFELPLGVKMKYQLRTVGGSGFVRVGGLNPAAKANESADIKERFMMRNPTREDSCWPDEQILPGFSLFMQNHFLLRVTLARAVARAFAVSLDLPEQYFDEYYWGTSHDASLNYYPPLTEAAVSRSQWSFSPHTDYNGFTLLSQDSLGGLQVRNSAGEWIDVPPRPDHFVVNIGDLMAMWTNDLYTSTLHRAANVKGVPRISIPFFASPNRSSIITTIETCISESNPTRYPAVAAGDYLNTLIEKADTTGRPGISDRTAGRLKTN